LVVVGLGNGLLLPQLLETVLSRTGPTHGNGFRSAVYRATGRWHHWRCYPRRCFSVPGRGTPPAAFAQAFGLAVALDVAISVAMVLVFALPRTNRPQG
jgi:hypothetical protein